MKKPEEIIYELLELINIQNKEKYSHNKTVRDSINISNLPHRLAFQENKTNNFIQVFEIFLGCHVRISDNKDETLDIIKNIIIRDKPENLISQLQERLIKEL
jgi:hypothetical protein